MDFDVGRFAHDLVTEIADAVIYADAKGEIRFWNKGAARIFGFSAAEALGQSLEIIIPENLRERHWNGFDETMRTGKSRYGAGDILAVPALRKDGARVSVEFTVAMVKDDAGKMVGIAAVLRDVTKRFEETKALKKRLAALEAAATSPSPQPFSPLPVGEGSGVRDRG
ncbi:MAG: PAS domain-containing protein [Acetobacteraceae bacterium]